MEMIFCVTLRKKIRITQNRRTTMVKNLKSYVLLDYLIKTKGANINSVESCIVRVIGIL